MKCFIWRHLLRIIEHFLTNWILKIRKLQLKRLILCFARLAETVMNNFSKSEFDDSTNIYYTNDEKLISKKNIKKN